MAKKPAKYEPWTMDWIALEEVVRLPRNPKGHDLGLLHQLFGQYGYLDALTVNVRPDGTHVLLGGHGRVDTAQQEKAAGAGPPAGIRVDNGRWLLPVWFTGLPPEKEEGACIALNRATERGGWEANLTEVLADLAATYPGELEARTGWDEEDLDRLLADAAAAYGEGAEGEGKGEDPGAEVDRAEELRAKWGTELGQVWKVGEHRIVCGDCTDRNVVERVMGGEKAALCFADPPYGMGKESEGIANDNLYRENLDAFLMAWWGGIRPSLDDNASVYIWGQEEDLWRLWYRGGLAESERLTFRNEIVWMKVYPGSHVPDAMGQKAAFRSYAPASERCLFFMLGEQGFNTNADNYWEGWEPIRLYLKEQRDKMGWSNEDCKRLAGHSEKSGCHWFDKSQWEFPPREVYQAWQKAACDAAFKREYDDLKREYDDLKREFYETRACFDNAHDNMTDVWSFERVQGEERWAHATPKPVGLVERAIKTSCTEGGLVIDPFLGSGTTLVACEKLGRKGRGIELEPKYVAVALERLVGMGLQAELVEP